MGNSQQRYVTNNDAIEIIGGDRWQLVKAKIERNGAKTIDFQLFQYIIHSRFEKMPNILIECLFNAFANDLSQRVDTDHFISSLSVLASDNRLMIAKFLFRIYENDVGFLERKRTTDIAKIAYGERLQVKREALTKLMFDLFDSKKRTEVNLKEFEQYNGRLHVMADWVIHVLKIFVENPPPKLTQLDRRYSLLAECDEMCARYGVHKSVGEQLRELYYKHCRRAASRLSNINTVIQHSGRAEMLMDTWTQWTVEGGYITPILAKVLFSARTQSYKQSWRFDDFAEFCMINSIGSAEARAKYVCSAFARHSRLTAEGRSSGAVEEDVIAALRYNLRCMLLSLTGCVYSTAHTDALILSPAAAAALLLPTSPSSDSVPQSPAVAAVEAPRPQFYSLNGALLGSSSSLSSAKSKDASPDSPMGIDLLSSLESKLTLAPAVRDALNKLGASVTAEEVVDFHVHILLQHGDLLPGLKDLSIAACGLFGVEPSTPLLEKEFITELTLRYMKHHTSRSLPFGPEGTEWCIINKAWLDSWRMNIGQQRQQPQAQPVTHSQKQLQQQQEETASGRRRGLPAIGNVSSKPVPPRPTAIDNWTIVKKHGARGQLLHGVLQGQDFEIVSPAVYSALYMWYGGSPRISRRVISNNGICEIEFFPLCVKILTCDAQGKVANLGAVTELLFSKTCTVADVIGELCFHRPKLQPDQVRLWNYARDAWKEQFILSPELTLSKANIQDGQAILLEVSLVDGTWPRSQLHASMESEEPQGQESGKDDDSSGAAEANGKAIHRDEVKRYFQLRAGGGLVGLDNLGNTCYLNSSLQALLHTTHLVDYFLSSVYTRDINIHNVDGFKGRLAHSFGKLALELYTAKRKCVTPRALYQCIASLREQFAGNEQHDAHELLAFLLDGLSEDLNLIHKKPYTEQPDSDGRPDAELADIWWQNHLKRDHSIIQSLFTGQFKSIVTCSCGYTSARYEPFTCLTVPIPEISHRILTVVVVPLLIQHTTQVSVNVPKSGSLEDVLEKVKSMSLTGLEPAEGDHQLHFLAGELVNARIRSFNSMDRKLDSIRENDIIGFFQTRSMPRPRAKPEEGIESDSSEKEPTHASTVPAGDGVLHQAHYQRSHWVRVSFTQRHAKLIDGVLFGAGGYDAFQPEPVGLSMLEVLPDNITGADLYQLMADRMSPFLKAQVSEFIARTTAPNAAPLEGIPEALNTIQPLETDEVMGGAAVPAEGFTLRLISGGAGKGTSCSRCSWIERCQGCCIPNKAEYVVQLSDGQCISIDWHYTVFEELIDTVAVAKVHQHPSVREELSTFNDAKVPLFNCLDKFTEREKLDGMVCPKCKEDNTLSKSFTIWRQPPALLVQIKRFQYDRVSRKKLNTWIDFPTDGLDVSNYMAPGRRDAQASLSLPVRATGDHPQSVPIPHVTRSRSSSSDDNSVDIVVPNVVLEGDQAEPDGDSEEVGEHSAAGESQFSAHLKQLALSSSTVEASGGSTPLDDLRLSDCMEYDLYCAIHHQGVLGGGHYVTTCRKVDPSRFDARGSARYSLADKWFLFNDHLVSEVEPTDVTGPSAYVLFYMRRDVQLTDFSDLLVSNPSHSPLTAPGDVSSPDPPVTSPHYILSHNLPRKTMITAPIKKMAEVMSNVVSGEGGEHRSTPLSPSKEQSGKRVGRSQQRPGQPGRDGGAEDDNCRVS